MPKNTSHNGTAEEPTPSYSDFLKHPQWQRKRLEVFERDKFTCRRCHAKESTLHVHHCYYEKGLRPWEYPLDAYLTLCEACHKQMTEMHQELKYLIGVNWWRSEQFLSYVKAVYSYGWDDGADYILEVKSHGQTRGVADAYGLSFEDVWNARQNGEVHHWHLVDLLYKGRLHKPTYLYVICRGDYIRFSHYRPDATAQESSAYRICVSPYGLEAIKADIEKAFANKHVNSEWFALTKEDLCQLQDMHRLLWSRHPF